MSAGRILPVPHVEVDLHNERYNNDCALIVVRAKGNSLREGFIIAIVGFSVNPPYNIGVGDIVPGAAEVYELGVGGVMEIVGDEVGVEDFRRLQEG